MPFLLYIVIHQPHVLIIISHWWYTPSFNARKSSPLLWPVAWITSVLVQPALWFRRYKRYVLQ